MSVKVIYKYELSPDGDNLPPGRVVHVGYQGDPSMLPVIWIEHEVDRLTEVPVPYYFFGTGHRFVHGNKTTAHVGSAVCGDFVWHVYKGG